MNDWLIGGVAGTACFFVLGVAGTAAQAAPAQRVTAPGDVHFYLECSTRSIAAVPDGVEAWMLATAAVDATGKVRFAETHLINGGKIDPKKATAKVTVTELPNAGGFSYELEGRLDDNGEATPNEYCNDFELYRVREPAKAPPAVQIVEAQPVSVGK